MYTQREIRITYKVLVEKPKKRHFGRHRLGCEDNIKMDLKT
jgi:hypothetical protein